MKEERKGKGEKRREAKFQRSVWNQAEDAVLKRMVRHSKDWWEISESLEEYASEGMRGKTPKQCRERWQNTLNPKIASVPWSEEEKEAFFELHALLGPKWSRISNALPGRTDNTVKNFFHCSLRKLVRRVRTGKVSTLEIGTESERKHALYLIDHVRAMYLSCHVDANSLAQRDKYIAGLVLQNELTAEKVDEAEQQIRGLVLPKLTNPSESAPEPQESASCGAPVPSPLLPPIPQSALIGTRVAALPPLDSVLFILELEKLRSTYTRRSSLELPLPHPLVASMGLQKSDPQRFPH